MWITEWRAIRKRIGGIREAASFFLRADTGEFHNSASEIINNVHGTVLCLLRFSEVYGAVLPVPARNCLLTFLRRYNDTFGGVTPAGTPKAGEYNGAVAVFTYTAGFCAEFEYLISDTAELVRSLTVRAFLHLQRSIVADEDVRARWVIAFGKNEYACEKLGAVHLLSHGIWAFKTSGAGEQTDLVYDEPRPIDSDAQRASIGLILTEWKIVRSPSELDGQIEAAYRQARRYRAGILAGIEVATPRYLVIVSDDHLTMPSPQTAGEATYEYRNIAVNPSAPSKQK